MTPLETYLAGIDPKAVPLVRALDVAIRRADPELDVAIKYRILMYSINADWRTWVVSINAVKNRVGLQFLYGVLLDDPLSVLRAGTSVLMTWDFAFDASVDADAVSAYVSEAVAKHDHYSANAPRILEESRAAAAKRGRRRR